MASSNNIEALNEWQGCLVASAENANIEESFIAAQLTFECCSSVQ
ncbi:hypothetical protein GPB2148_1824 [marine gamma proteobacterium HTCC2148]|nr:hypothetical protein GPB2148_1824 [marine gamma proteobacterium HTCC2148]